MTSNISTQSSLKESTDSEQENDRMDESCEQEESNLCPFKLLWSFGMNPGVPLINLTTENRTIIVYACSHAAVIYNYESREAMNLQGHKNVVKTLSASTNGKWLLSADFEKDSVVVVWDTESGVPICTLFNTHGEKEITAARISPNAKYIVTVGNEIPQKVHFWLWTYGRDEPDGTMELSEIVSDRVKEIAFNEDFPEEFILTADSNVTFCTWENNKLKCCYPKILGDARRYGLFSCSCYVLKTHRVLTATTNGYALVWSTVPVDKGRGKIDNEEKKHIKSVRLEKSSITVILHHDGLIVIGTSEGRINFYDLELKILYWCRNCGLDSIQSISFDLRSSLLAPVPIPSESELGFSEEDDIEYEYEGEFEGYVESKSESVACDERMEYLKKIESLKDLNEVSSSMTINLEVTFRNHDRSQEKLGKLPDGPTDATLESAPFYIGNFFVGSLNGMIAQIEISALKCRYISRDICAPVTSLDVHPRSHFIVTGNIHGFVCLYDYEKRKPILRRKTPSLPNFRTLLDNQVKSGNIIYVTCPQSHEKLTTVTTLKYSPIGDILACGLENGALWILHPITLEPLDKNPYKHSRESILQLTFTECGEYMAYSDNTLVVAAFKRNRESIKGNHLWDFIGKYRAHYGTIRDLLFGPATSTSVVARLVSLGEDQNLIEYDLKNSGPYPYPGLKISEIHRIEYNAIPLCLSWYPQLGIEGFLVISNSEYKYRLLNDVTKMIRGTFLGPLFDAPVQRFKVLPGKGFKDSRYMVFATEREIGLQILPFDGNPYKILGITGHPRKVTNICINCDGNILFTSGYNDPCVLMWRIKRRSVDVLARLGGENLSPYYCLIEGGRKGWLINEMKDLFYYAQILHQGENTTATRIVSEKVSTKQIPNLMRAIGYYPSNEEIEIFMGEISYRKYAETGQLVEEITFEDFVKLYINHRPAFGVSLRQLQEAFQVFTNPNRHPFLDQENPVLTREQFMKMLFGEGPEGVSKEKDKLYGEPLSAEEACMYLKFLIGSDPLEDVHEQDKDKRSVSVDFTFLPERISYKDFTADIMGIELPEETRADDN